MNKKKKKGSDDGIIGIEMQLCRGQTYKIAVTDTHTDTHDKCIETALHFFLILSIYGIKR